MDHILIMAPNYRLFRHYCAKHNLNPKTTIYIDRADTIMSLENTIIFDLIGDQYGLFDVSPAIQKRLAKIETWIGYRKSRGVQHKTIWMEQAPDNTDQ